MKIQFDNFQLFVDTTYFNPNKKTILFIHGFTGSSFDWNEVIPFVDDNFSILAIDLIGHGKSSSPEVNSVYKIQSVISQIKKVLDEMQVLQVILCGYSMGGRVSLSFANCIKQRILGLILESTSPGIEDSNERYERLNSDTLLSQKIINEGIDWFVDYWMNLPIFSSQNILPTEKLRLIREQKQNNSPIGLAKTLQNSGVGNIDFIWEELQNMNFPVLLIAGQDDPKYCIINEKMNQLFPNSELYKIENSGHNTHLEKPSEFVILVNRFLRTYFL